MSSARVSPHVEVRQRQSCPLCQDSITALPHLIACPACQAIHHRDCVTEMGHCGTMGCVGMDALVAETRAAAQGGFGDGEEPGWRQSAHAEHDVTHFQASLRLADLEISRFQAAISYVANIAGAAFILPGLIYYQAKKKGDDFSRHHAQQALLLSLATLLTLGLFAPLMVVFSILGAIKAYRGEWWAPPLIRRFASDTAKTERAKQILAKPVSK